MVSKQRTIEANFDGIVGPTHNYSGLSYGNIASKTNQYNISNPREAALQGLRKMKFLADHGIIQGVLPPQERPHLPTLRALGFCGSDKEIIEKAFKTNPEIFFAVSSAACMWTANAATASPSCDSTDAILHITPANLSSKFHRSIEHNTTATTLRQIFAHPKYFYHHAILPTGETFADEGAANHCRFSLSHGTPGVQLFVFGRHSFGTPQLFPKTFPARQSFEASQAIARRHCLPEERIVFAQQHPKAIDAGAFHNDVVALSNENVFLFHEYAFANKNNIIDELREKLLLSGCQTFHLIEVKEADISLSDAISTYLFNSQIITLPTGNMLLLAPTECQKQAGVKDYLEQHVHSQHSPIQQIEYIDLHESMRNGGGPACLRLRIVLNPDELAATNPRFLLNRTLYNKLIAWVQQHYRDRLSPHDLADPQLLDETRNALEALSKILY